MVKALVTLTARRACVLLQGAVAGALSREVRRRQQVGRGGRESGLVTQGSREGGHAPHRDPADRRDPLPSLFFSPPNTHVLLMTRPCVARPFTRRPRGRGPGAVDRAIFAYHGGRVASARNRAVSPSGRRNGGSVASRAPLPADHGTVVTHQRGFPGSCLPILAPLFSWP